MLRLTGCLVGSTYRVWNASLPVMFVAVCVVLVCVFLMQYSLTQHNASSDALLYKSAN